MFISVTEESGKIHNVEVSSSLPLGSLKALIEDDTKIPSDDLKLVYNGIELVGDDKTVGSFGINNYDIVLALRKTPVASSSVSSSSGANRTSLTMQPEQIRQQIISNASLRQHLSQQSPELVEAALNNPAKFTAMIKAIQEQQKRQEEELALADADPFDVEAQKKIEEMIRMRNVDENRMNAMEYHPEVFGTINMLYINMEVNNYPIKAFVDSGVNPELAKRCGLDRLVDTRYQGVAKGVPILLVADLCPVPRFQACIDLKKNVLVIGDEEVPFLGESEIPNMEHRLSSSDIASPSAAQPSSSNAYPEEAIQTLVNLGNVSREEAQQALEACGGDLNAAINMLI